MAREEIKKLVRTRVCEMNPYETVKKGDKGKDMNRFSEAP